MSVWVKLNKDSALNFFVGVRQIETDGSKIKLVLKHGSFIFDEKYYSWGEVKDECDND